MFIKLLNVNKTSTKEDQERNLTIIEPAIHVAM